MKQCAFLSMDRLDDFEHYDYMLKEPLAELGWEVREVSWRKRETDWDRFAAVVIRTPWDYHHEPEPFLEALEAIDRSSAQLENSLELIRWNINKTYLHDLENHGIRIVPTKWGDTEDQITEEMMMAWFDKFESEEIILKPTISAGADRTYRLDRYAAREKLDEIGNVFSNRAYMVQPLMERILDEGEYSLIYFGKEYSHALLKTPEKADFRVQEEHGGILKTVEPEQELQNISERILTEVDPIPLYSRVDLVRDASGSFSLMELELIEPSLYFNMDPESPKRFARFFNEWMQNKH